MLGDRVFSRYDDIEHERKLCDSIAGVVNMGMPINNRVQINYRALLAVAG